MICQENYISATKKPPGHRAVPDRNDRYGKKKRTITSEQGARGMRTPERTSSDPALKGEDASLGLGRIPSIPSFKDGQTRRGTSSSQASFGKEKEIKQQQRSSLYAGLPRGKGRGRIGRRKLSLFVAAI